MDVSPRPSASYVVAVSRASYRGVLLFETGEDIKVFLGNKEYSFQNVEEATAFIDAVYATVIIPN